MLSNECYLAHHDVCADPKWCECLCHEREKLLSEIEDL